MEITYECPHCLKETSSIPIDLIEETKKSFKYHCECENCGMSANVTLPHKAVVKMYNLVERLCLPMPDESQN